MSWKDMLFRQVHPAHFKNGLSSGAFRPTPSDKDRLSVDCGNMTTPEASYELHKKKSKTDTSGNVVHLQTEGTWAITREACRIEGLAVTPDIITNQPGQPDNPAHHLVDFSSVQGNSKNKNGPVSKRLRQVALCIGRLWP